MYTCNGCKKSFDGAPAMYLGKRQSVKYCPHCKAVWRAKMLEGLRERNALAVTNTNCIWCGKQTTAQDRENGVCNEHEEFRDKLRELIKKSPHVYKYVADKEVKYGPARDANIAAQKLARKQQTELGMPAPAPADITTALGELVKKAAAGDKEASKKLMQIIG